MSSFPLTCVGRILESDISKIAAAIWNDGNVEIFVGYKYPTHGLL